MTLDSQPWQNYRLLEPCECVDLCDLGEVPPFYNPIEPQIQPQPCPIQRPDVHTAYKECRQRALERLLDKLNGKQLVGRDYAEWYLRETWGRPTVFQFRQKTHP